MDQKLSALSVEAIAKLKDAHAYITILIAGADGNIDKNELAWAEKIVQIRTYTGDEGMQEFHDQVNAELPGKIKAFMASLPSDIQARSQIVSDKLSELNPILASLDPSTGAYLYKGYLSLASRIAKASGGILSFFSIGPEEKKWMGLPMLTPIEYDPEEEE